MRTDEDEDIDYDFDELDELAHAYAITIHRSQGSEYPAVVIPLTTSAWMMLQRNLLYTAVTRAKSWSSWSAPARPWPSPSAPPAPAAATPPSPTASRARVRPDRELPGRGQNQRKQASRAGAPKPRATQ